MGIASRSQRLVPPLMLGLVRDRTDQIAAAGLARDDPVGDAQLAAVDGDPLDSRRSVVEAGGNPVLPLGVGKFRRATDGARFHVVMLTVMVACAAALFTGVDPILALNDIGFTIPARGSTYWHDEAMGSRDFNDLDETPEAVASTTEAAARNAVHLAKLLRHRDYPAYS
jgi:hypothetical protein